MSSLRLIVVACISVPACLSSDHRVYGFLPSDDFDCASVHILAVNAKLETLADETDACGFSFSGKDFTFSFSVPDGTEQLQVTFEEDSTDDDGPVDVTLTVQGPIHDDVSLGAV